MANHSEVNGRNSRGAPKKWGGIWCKRYLAWCDHITRSAKSYWNIKSKLSMRENGEPTRRKQRRHITMPQSIQQEAQAIEVSKYQ